MVGWSSRLRVAAVAAGMVLGLVTSTTWLASAPSWAGGVLDTSLTSLRQIHYLGTSTLLPNGRILMAGGTNLNCLDDPLSDQAEVYDPKTNTSSPAGAITRSRHTATLLRNGKVLVAGGQAPSRTATTRLYRPAANDWVSRAPMRTARDGHVAVRLANGKVLVVGGNDGAATAEVYRPRANAWRAVKAPLKNNGVIVSNPVLMKDGRVFVLFDSATAPAQIYQPSRNRWSRAATLTQFPHPDNAAATLLDDGQVFVASGTFRWGLGSRVDLFDPSTRRWNNVYRGEGLNWPSSAVTLDSGDVLLGLNGGNYMYGVPLIIRYDVKNNVWTNVHYGEWDGLQMTQVPGFGVVFSSMGQDWRECLGGLGVLPYQDGVPGPPGSVTLGAGDRTLTVQWTAPNDNGASPITGYTVSVAGIGPTRTVKVGGTARAVSITGLSNGDAYSATVTATNSRGVGTPETSTRSVVGPAACTISGTNGPDTLTGTSGDDIICGLGGNDTIKGSPGNDTILGGAGSDTIDYSHAPIPVNANLATGRGTGWPNDTDALAEIENVTGSNYADTITGDDGNNVLKGRAGEDMFKASYGSDFAYGGSEDDTFELNPAWENYEEPSQYFGGLGSDTIIFADSPSTAFADLNQGRAVAMTSGDWSSGVFGSDMLTQIENVISSTYTPAVFLGSDEANILTGGDYGDILRGAGGNDTLSGLGGDDLLYGDADQDALNGGPDTDTCIGGAGTDTAQACERTVGVP